MKDVFLEHSLTLGMHVCRLDVAPSDAGRRIEHRGPTTRDFAIFCLNFKSREEDDGPSMHALLTTVGLYSIPSAKGTSIYVMIPTR